MGIRKKCEEFRNISLNEKKIVIATRKKLMNMVRYIIGHLREKDFIGTQCRHISMIYSTRNYISN